MRAGPLCDARIIRLVNRRFVPYFFSLDSYAPMADPDATEFVTRHRTREQLGSIPPVLVTDADGKILDAIEQPNEITPDDFLKRLLAVLDAHPQYTQLTEAELALEPVPRARVYIDLLQYDAARKLLTAEPGDEAQYLLGHIARLEGRWDDMQQHFSAISEPQYAGDIRMEQAYRLWNQRDNAALAQQLRDFPADHARSSEARYYYGLALHHNGQSAEAVKAWGQEVQTCGEDAWVYRADWARQNLSSESMLGRTYLGMDNPDLTR